MRTPTRWFAMALAAALLLLSAAALVDEFAVHATDGAVRRPPDWWTGMVTGRSLLWGGLAAASTALLAALCLIALARLLGAGRRGATVFAVGDPIAQVTITRTALENLLRGALPVRLPEVVEAVARVSGRGGQVAVAVGARVSGCDLAALHGRVAAVVAEELGRAGGPGLAELRLEIVEIVEIVGTPASGGRLPAP